MPTHEICFWIMGEAGENTRAGGEHSNATQKGTSQELNQRPSCSEATALTNDLWLCVFRIVCPLYQQWQLLSGLPGQRHDRRSSGVWHGQPGEWEQRAKTSEWFLLLWNFLRCWEPVTPFPVGVAEEHYNPFCRSMSLFFSVQQTWFQLMTAR